MTSPAPAAIVIGTVPDRDRTPHLDDRNEAPVDVSALGARLAQPRRPRLADARAAVEGAATGEQAWQRLHERGLIGGELLRSPGRRFAVANTERSAAAAGGDQLDLQPAPATVDAAVALGSDAAGVLEAERLARVLRARLAPWGAAAVERIDWVVVTHQTPLSFRQVPGLALAMYSLELALQLAGTELRSLRVDDPALPSFVNNVIRADLAWPRAVARSLEVPDEYRPPAAVVGARFASLENPFGIAVALWDQGYVLDHSCDRDPGTARLYTHVADAPPNLLQRVRGAREQGG